MKKKKTPKKSKGGRPTRYKKEYDEQARKLCLLGYTDKELADFFRVSESTLNLWKLRHKEFSESLKKGKDFADMEIVDSLRQRAKGMTVLSQKAIKVKTGQFTEEIEIVEVSDGIPPETNAIKFWLMNRQSDKWREKQENVNLNTNINIDTEPTEQQKQEAIERVLKGKNEFKDYE